MIVKRGGIAIIFADFFPAEVPVGIVGSKCASHRGKKHDDEDDDGLDHGYENHNVGENECEIRDYFKSFPILRRNLLKRFL